MKQNNIENLLKASSKAVCLMLAPALFVACTGDVVMHQYENTDVWKWQQDDTVKFNLPEITRNCRLEAEIGVRTTSSYPFASLYLLGTMEKNNVPISTDTITVSIYNKRGNENGKGFPYYTTVKPIPALHVDSGATYTYKITHFMAEPSIKGVKSIGLKLELAE